MVSTAHRDGIDLVIAKEIRLYIKTRLGIMKLVMVLQQLKKYMK